MKSIQIVKKVRSLAAEHEQTVPQDYFVGLTDLSKDQVLNAHKLNHGSSIYSFYEATNEAEAKKALLSLLDLDMNGFPVNGNIPGKTLYCYCIESSSVEHALSDKIEW